LRDLRRSADRLECICQEFDAGDAAQFSDGVKVVGVGWVMFRARIQFFT
jgi:hypothetical protein